MGDNTSSAGKTKWIYMGDPQCEKISADPDYSSWGRLLGVAYNVAYGSEQDSPDGKGELEEGEKLLILGGDLVNHGDTDLEWDGFFSAGGELLKKVKVITPTGNHEKRADSGYEKKFDIPANGPVGYEQRFYSYEYGCCHFTVLDTNYMGQKSEQAKDFITGWLRSDLERSSKEITIIVMHHPLFTVGTSLDDEIRAENMRNVYLPVFKEFGVDMILCGHQHLYCRTDEHLTPIMQIMGVSGSKHYCGRDYSLMAVGLENISVATVFEADKDRISFRTINEEGDVLDEFSICPNSKNITERTCKTSYEDNAKSLTQTEQTIETEQALESQQNEQDMEEMRADPLRPGYYGRIEIIDQKGKSLLMTAEEVRKMPHTKVSYSVTRGRNTKTETVTGVRLADLLGNARLQSNVRDSDVVIFTSEDGNDVAIEVSDLRNRYRFRNIEGTLDAKQVPAMIFSEYEGSDHSPFRLMIGQSREGECNGRYRMRNIVKIELLRR